MIVPGVLDVVIASLLDTESRWSATIPDGKLRRFQSDTIMIGRKLTILDPILPLIDSSI